MNIGHEVESIPQDLEGLVKGDISLGGKKIPKVAVAGVVVGLVVLLAVYTRKKSSGSSSGSGSGGGGSSGSGLGSSGDSFGGSTASDIIGGIDASPSNSPLNNIPLPDIPIPVLTNSDTNPNAGEIPSIPYAPDMSGYNIPFMGSYGNYSDNTGINGDNVPIQVTYPTNGGNTGILGGVFKGRVADSRKGVVTKVIPKNNPLNKSNTSKMVLTKLPAKTTLTPTVARNTITTSLKPIANVVTLIGNLFNQPKPTAYVAPVIPYHPASIPQVISIPYHPSPLPKATPIFTSTKHTSTGGV